ncbi:hypothetical protein J1614_000121 [Plenodomus biglobosus]|nr:hypothetical protein J1614_000121 [Plenodomus biglobosus]
MPTRRTSTPCHMRLSSVRAIAGRRVCNLSATAGQQILELCLALHAPALPSLDHQPCDRPNGEKEEMDGDTVRTGHGLLGRWSNNDSTKSNYAKKR